MEDFKKLILELFKFNLLLSVVGFGWIILEVLLMGEAAPRKVDNVISIIFALSLYFNLKNLEAKIER